MKETSATPSDVEAPVPDVVLPSRSVLKRLKLSPEVAWFLLSRGYDLPECPPKVKTPEPRLVAGAQFDPDRVDVVIRAFKALRHTQGTLAGKPLAPDSWQVAYMLAPVFGWVKRNDLGHWVRIIQTLYVDVPRKNGKSTISGGIAIYLTAADGEQGAQVVAAASTKDQAGFVFQPIKKIAESAPLLRGRVRPLTAKILHPRTGSYFQVVSSAADAQHGANLHGAIIDELHVHKTPDLVETLETGTGSREQPLIVMITTADDGRPNSIYARKRRYVEQLAKGVFKDPATFGVVFAADEDDDPFVEATWRKANPGYPVSPTRNALTKAATEAKNSPEKLAAFKRLHLGIRTKQTTAFIDMADWDRNGGKRLILEDYEGRLAYGGLDLGSVSDLTSLCWVIPHEDDEGVDVIWRHWAPEDVLEHLDKRTAGAASTWVDEGRLFLTPGNVTDYEAIRQQVLEDVQVLDVRSIGFDRWNATHLVNLLQEDGVALTRVGQGFQTMSPAMKEVLRLVRKGKRGAPMLAHGSDPVMRWMVDNLAVSMDAAGNVKPDKKNAADKIDGVSALANAVSELLVIGERKTSDGTMLLI